jgi:hypothetical protein
MRGLLSHSNVPVQYLCLVHNSVYNFIFVALMPGNTCALIPKIPEASQKHVANLERVRANLANWRIITEKCIVVNHLRKLSVTRPFYSKGLLFGN